MPDLKHVHFIGIAGSGMSGLAILAKQQGIQVTGSDQKPSHYLDAVLAEGIPVNLQQGPENINGRQIDLVVVSTAVSADHAELAAARRQGIPVWRRAQMLDWLGRGRRCLAVAGTHGKTTTSSMLATTLIGLGTDPSFLVGGTLTAYGTSARAGTGQDYVIEADESDESFTYLHPYLAIITNIEKDHMDHYGSLPQIQAAFRRFIQTIDRKGCLVCCVDDENLEMVARQSGRPLISYGLSADADYCCLPQDGRSFIMRYPDGQELSISITAAPGVHNMLNGSAVLAACDWLGFDRLATATALMRYGGTKRRFEYAGQANGVLVIDDYGHHPTEVKVTLAALRGLGYQRIHLLFQPHRYSRLKELFDDFVGAFEDADTVNLLQVYAAGEEPVPGVDSAWLIDALQKFFPEKPVQLIPDRGQAAAIMAAIAKKGDVIVVMGAGDVCELTPEILSALQAAESADYKDKSLAEPPVADNHCNSLAKPPGADDHDNSLASANKAAGSWSPPTVATPTASQLKIDNELPPSVFEAYCELEGSIQGNLMLNEPMSRHTSFRIGGPVALFVECATFADLSKSLALIQSYQLPWTIVGKGSNLLVADQGFKGAVLTLGQEFKSFHFPGEEPNRSWQPADADDRGVTGGQCRSDAAGLDEFSGSARLVAGAGVVLSNLVQGAFKRGCSGLEFAVGIPGTLGGAVYMNAGSRDVWISSALCSLTVYSPGKGLVRYRAEELPWAYRQSGIPLGEVVVEAELLVRRDNLGMIRSKMEGSLRHRRKTQPLSELSAGSVFRNPEGASAGQLIDSLGLKGFTVGDASVSEVHANFIINRGQAKAVEVVALIQEIRRRVKESYGTELTPEIRFVGFS